MGKNPLFLLYMDIVNRVTEILKSITEQETIEIVDISYKREGGTMVLRILLDKENGITVDECRHINNQLSEILDKENIIDEHYILEVSSPGLDRSMKNRKDFERVLGKCIKVTTYAPINGQNVFIGKLLGIGESTIVIEDERGVSTEIPQSKIAKAKLEVTVR